MNLQMFAEPEHSPAAGGDQPGAEQQPKTYTEDEVGRLLREAQNTAAAKARKATEAEWKPKLDEAQKAAEAAKPFVSDPVGYITQYLAGNPATMQAVANGVEAIYSGKAPTQAQVAAVGRASDSATDPRVAAKLEELEKEMQSLRERTTLQTDLKGYASDWSKAFSGEAFNQDEFLAYADKYAEENGIDDDDPVDTRLLYRAFKAERQAEVATSRRTPKLPGGAPPPSAPKADPKGKTWDDLESMVEARLRASRD